MRLTLSSAILTALLATSAFAARFPANAPATTNNDDACDIGVYPAATLLLPYFEVDYGLPPAVAATTLLTVTNTSAMPQIAQVTLWTDYAFPVVVLDLFLTGYDVQALNLYDVIARGIIAPTSSTSGGTSIDTPEGNVSRANTANPNFGPRVALECAQGVLPGRIPPGLLADLRSGLSAGTMTSCGTAKIGSTHAATAAIGFATVDVVSSCAPTLPGYAPFIDNLLYDNVLTGDYEQINPNAATGNYAGGNPMVHIRAIPEGGPAAATTPTNLANTFYGRITPRGGSRTRDRRQPLSSAFAARFIQGGTGAFNTNLKVWREAVTGPSPACTDFRANAVLQATEVVRFDEHENATAFGPALFPIAPRLEPTAAAFSASTASAGFVPPLSGSGDAGGWIYLNLQNPAPGPDALPPGRGTQNWIVVSMSAEGRYSVDMDASPLGNGCSPPAPLTEATNGTGVIGPRP